ncbi:triadin-like [Tupaia chinensis]|uniref:triadin-like n=1 Tax=Tupaia chinensis TaxID=246437 RepID=UPI000FFB9E5E|nr:triadin-like [Tupaia chinensis]
MERSKDKVVEIIPETVNDGSKEAKPKPPQPQVKKGEKPASPEKAQIHKEDIVKAEKTISHGKPEEKVLKQVKTVTIEKTVKPKPEKKAEHQEKELPSVKADKQKTISKRASEDTESGKYLFPQKW